MSEFHLDSKRHFTGLVHDISQRKQTEQALRDSEARLKAILEQLPVAVGVMDMSGNWTRSNPLMNVYVPRGIPSMLPDQVTHWSAWDEHGQPLPPEEWPGKRALRGEIVTPGLEMLHTTDDGRELWMRVSTAPLYDAAGRIVGATCVAQDIDEIKRAEAALKEADRRKDEFLATLGHELRNVLAPVAVGAQLLRDAGAHPDLIEQAATVIHGQIHVLTRLVDDLLDVSRIAEGKLELRYEPLDLPRSCTPRSRSRARQSVRWSTNSY